MEDRNVKRCSFVGVCMCARKGLNEFFYAYEIVLWYSEELLKLIILCVHVEMLVL